MVQGILIARALGVELYGVLGIVMTFVMVLNRLTAFRMNEFLIKFVTDALAAHREDTARAMIKVAMVAEAFASFLSFNIVLLLSAVGERFFVHLPKSQDLIVLYAFVILGNPLSETTSGIFHVFNKFRLQSVLTCVGRAVSLVAVLLL